MSDALNFHQEHSRLDPAALARWQGLPLCWVDARSHTFSRRLVTDRPVLALIDAGAAQADITFDQRAVHLDVSQGTIGLFEPGAARSSRWRCDAVRRILLQVDIPWLADRGLAEGDWHAVRFLPDVAFRDEALAALMRAMVHEVAQGSPNGSAYAESLSVRLVARLAATHGEGQRPVRERGRLTPSQLRRVDALIDSRLDERISLAALAEATGFSAPQFTRLFRRAVGVSPHQHVLRRRVTSARTLIAQTDLSLAAVAAATGFATQSHMNAVFLKLLGTTPGRCRTAAPAPPSPLDGARTDGAEPGRD
jgi:AraC family transcriptional regulator